MPVSYVTDEVHTQSQEWTRKLLKILKWILRVVLHIHAIVWVDKCLNYLVQRVQLILLQRQKYFRNFSRSHESHNRTLEGSQKCKEQEKYSEM